MLVEWSCKKESLDGFSRDQTPYYCPLGSFRLNTGLFLVKPNAASQHCKHWRCFWLWSPMLCFQCLRCSFQSIGVFCGVGALVFSAFSSVAVYCAFPVITSSIAVITVEMVITILATDFYCNFCKTHSATNINVTSFSWFQNRMSGGFYHLQQLGFLMVHQLALVGAIKSAMFWIFLLYGAQWAMQRYNSAPGCCSYSALQQSGQQCTSWCSWHFHFSAVEWQGEVSSQ